MISGISADSASTPCTDSAHCCAVWLRRVTCRLNTVVHCKWGFKVFTSPPFSFGSSDTCNSGHMHVCYCSIVCVNCTCGWPSWVSSPGWDVDHLANEVRNASWRMCVNSNARSHHELVRHNVGASPHELLKHASTYTWCFINRLNCNHTVLMLWHSHDHYCVPKHHPKILIFACCIQLLIAKHVLHKGALTDGDRCSHLVLSDPDTDHWQQPLSGHVSLVWPACTNRQTCAYAFFCKTIQQPLQNTTLQFAGSSVLQWLCLTYASYNERRQYHMGQLHSFKLYLHKQCLLDGMTVRTAFWACWFHCVLVLYQNLSVRIMFASKLPKMVD